MTGGQMAPTTILGQKTATTPFGRDAKRDGYPLRVCELLASISGACYIERVSVSNPKNIIKTKKAIKKGFENQLNNLGFSLIEVLSQCPTDWQMTPIESIKWIDDILTKTFPLGVFKECTKK